MPRDEPPADPGKEVRRTPREAAWRGRRVLVTGHTGFKGSWLALWLCRLGAEVTGYALAPPSDPSLFELADVERDIRSVRGDVRDLDHLVRVVEEATPEVVFHLAAQALVRPSYADPVETLSTNVMGTVHLFEAVRRAATDAGGPRAVVNVTSDKCYENREWVWPYREVEPMGGHDPYSASKGCAELLTAAYRSSFFTPRDGIVDDDGVAVASARAGNVIGGGDWAADRLIPDLVRAISAGEPLGIRRPDAVRPWQHVLDALAGYLDLAEHLLGHGPDERRNYAEGWNFGPADNDARTVGWIVERLVERWNETTGEAIDVELDPGPHPHEAGLLRLDASKARARLGWRPRLDLGTALDWIVEWHAAQLRGDDVRSLSESQIERYQALLP